ncbi:hypothetical protein HK405_008235, partial [Cladochytrium tenue]
MPPPSAKSGLSPYTQLALDVFATTDTALKKVVKNTEMTAATESGAGHVSRVNTENVTNACLAAAAEGLVPGMCETAAVALAVLQRYEEDDHVRVLIRKTRDAEKWLNSHQRRWWHLKKRRMRNTEALERGTKELKGELQVLAVQVVTKAVAGKICRAVKTAIEPLSQDSAKPSPNFSSRIETVLNGTRKAIGAAMELNSSATIEGLKTPLVKIQEAGTAFQAFINSYKRELRLLHGTNSIQKVAHMVGSVLAAMAPIVRQAGDLLVAANILKESEVFIWADILEFAASAVPKITALLLNLSTKGIRAGAGTETADQLAALVKEIERSCPKIAAGIQSLTSISGQNENKSHRRVIAVDLRSKHDSAAAVAMVRTKEPFRRTSTWGLFTRSSGTTTTPTPRSATPDELELPPTTPAAVEPATGGVPSGGSASRDPPTVRDRQGSVDFHDLHRRIFGEDSEYDPLSSLYSPSHASAADSIDYTRRPATAKRALPEPALQPPPSKRPRSRLPKLGPNVPTPKRRGKPTKQRTSSGAHKEEVGFSVVLDDDSADDSDAAVSDGRKRVSVSPPPAVSPSAVFGDGRPDHAFSSLTSVASAVTGTEWSLHSTTPLVNLAPSRAGLRRHAASLQRFLSPRLTALAHTDPPPPPVPAAASALLSVDGHLDDVSLASPKLNVRVSFSFVGIKPPRRSKAPANTRALRRRGDATSRPTIVAASSSATAIARLGADADAAADDDYDEDDANDGGDDSDNDRAAADNSHSAKDRLLAAVAAGRSVVLRLRVSATASATFWSSPAARAARPAIRFDRTDSATVLLIASANAPIKSPDLARLK